LADSLFSILITKRLSLAKGQPKEKSFDKLRGLRKFLDTPKSESEFQTRLYWRLLRTFAAIQLLGCGFGALGPSW
jgi:hypothetical protein